MELLICGSGASEAVPALFCTCGLCMEAWKRGGKDWRSRTAYQLGEEVRIDFGPDFLLHREKYRLHYEKLKHLFITHAHKDHFTPVQLNYHVHGAEGPALLGDFNLTLHGTKEVIDRFQAARTHDFSKMRMILDELSPDVDVRTLENGMKFTSIRANHCPGAVHYIVEMPDGFTFFIGTDSAVFREETWRKLSAFRFDLMIIDATAGRLDIENGGHMNAHQALATVGRLRKEGIARKSARILTNHFAHCAGMLHEDLEKFFLPHGIEPAYDGMCIPLWKESSLRK